MRTRTWLDTLVSKILHAPRANHRGQHGTDRAPRSCFVGQNCQSCWLLPTTQQRRTLPRTSQAKVEFIDRHIIHRRSCATVEPRLLCDGPHTVPLQQQGGRKRWQTNINTWRLLCAWAFMPSLLTLCSSPLVIAIAMQFTTWLQGALRKECNVLQLVHEDERGRQSHECETLRDILRAMRLPNEHAAESTAWTCGCYRCQMTVVVMYLTRSLASRALACARRHSSTLAVGRAA